jgi:hypothetical protein
MVLQGRLARHRLLVAHRALEVLGLPLRRRVPVAPGRVLLLRELQRAGLLPVLPLRVLEVLAVVEVEPPSYSPHMARPAETPTQN